MNSAFDWAAIAVAALSLTGTVYAVWSKRRKVDADAADVITDSAANLVKILDMRVKSQQDRIAALECNERDNARRIDELSRLSESQQREIADLRAGVRLLCRQIEDMGGRPVWAPMRVVPPSQE